MSLLKFIPAVIAIGTVASIAAGAIVSLLDEDTTAIKHDEQTKQDVLAKMKRVQNELARFSDLKILNDKREATNQVHTIELKIGDVEINELLAQLEEELHRLTAKYNKFDVPKKRS